MEHTYSDDPSAVNLTAWLATPFVYAGPTAGSLHQYRAQKDTISRTGTPAQLTTTWDTFGRSYITSIATIDPDAGEIEVAPERPGPGIVPQTPTADQLAEIDAGQRYLYKKGNLVYCHGMFIPTTEFDAYTVATPAARKALQIERLGKPYEAFTDTDPAQTSPQTPSAASTAAPNSARTDSSAAAPHEAPLSKSAKKKLQKRATRLLADPPPHPPPKQPAQSDDPPEGTSTSNPETASEHLLPRKARDERQKFYVNLVDRIPVRVFEPSSAETEADTILQPPKTQLAQILDTKLTEPTIAALSSMLRGPGIRDSIILLALAKALPARGTTFCDVAPLLRCRLMQLSLDLCCYKTDMAQKQFIRGVVPHDHGVSITLHHGLHIPMVSMPVDVFVQYLTVLPLHQNHQYHPTEIDKTWVAIPITQTQAASPGLIPYIASFLHSSLWAGCVNVHSKMTISDPETGAFVAVGVQTHMPGSNSVYIPGPLRAVLVIIDHANYDPHDAFMVGGHRIPYMRIDGVVENQADFAVVWRQWFSTPNISNVIRGLHAAHSDLDSTLACTNTSNMANALAAEVYPCWRPGLAIPSLDHTPDSLYDWESPSGGGYAFTERYVDTVALGRDSNVQLAAVHPAAIESVLWRQRMKGYNFAALSAHMQSPTGLARTRVVPNAHLGWGAVVWKDAVPDTMLPMYNVPVCTSIVRLAIVAGLLERAQYLARFADPGSYQAWSHMVSGAYSANTACFLTTNDITQRDWTGYETDGQNHNRTIRFRSMKRKLLLNTMTHIDITAMFRDWRCTTRSNIMSYYNMDPVTSIDWLSMCPVPISFTIQWAVKLGLYVIDEVEKFRYFTYARERNRGIPLPPGAKYSKIHLAGVLDTKLLVPRVYRNAVPTGHMYALWLDSYPSLSSDASCRGLTTSSSIVHSSTPTYTSLNIDASYIDNTTLYVIDSCMDSAEPSRFHIITTPITDPDPPTWQDVLRTAKNFLALPPTSENSKARTDGWLQKMIEVVGGFTSDVKKDLETAAKQADKIQDAQGAAAVAMHAAGDKTAQSAAKDPANPNPQNLAVPARTTQAPTSPRKNPPSRPPSRTE